MDYVAGLTGPEGRNFYNVRTGEVVPAGSNKAVGRVRKEGRRYRAIVHGQPDMAKTCKSEAAAVVHVLQNY